MVVKKLSKVVCLALSTVILSTFALPGSVSAQTTEYMGLHITNKAEKPEKVETVNIEYNGYSFDIPSYWGDPIEVGCEMYFIDESGTLPLMYMTYAPKDYYTEKYNNTPLRIKDYFSVLESSLDDFIEYVFTSSDFGDSSKTFIAGKPAITRTGTCVIDGVDDAFVAQFIDDENIYVIMIVDYEDSGSTIFDDIEDMLNSFNVVIE